jgi:ribosomal-protein-alanine N-acetyltransferase
MNIRRAERSDVPGILAIEQSVVGAAHWSPAKYTEIIEGSGLRRILVAEADGLLQGFLVARTLGDEWEIENIAVGMQRQGLGSQLLSDLLREARSERVAKIWLEVRESNRSARLLYQKFLFEEHSMRENYYHGPIENAIIYMLCL